LSQVEATTRCDSGKIPKYVTELFDDRAGVPDVRCAIPLLLLDFAEQASGFAEESEKREGQRSMIATLVRYQGLCSVLRNRKRGKAVRFG
jgi:hypothetical protein